MGGNDDLSAVSEAEQRLLRATEHGLVADLAGAVIRAEVVRDIALRAPDGTPVQIRRAVIDGPLDLDRCRFGALLLAHVTLRGGLRFRDSACRGLALMDCSVEDAMLGSGARIEGPLRIQGGTVGGGLDLSGADLTGALSCDGVTVTGRPLAFAASDMRVGGNVLLDRSRFEGGVSLDRANVAAGVSVSHARIVGADAQLSCVSARLGGSIEADRTQIDGPLHLMGAEVAGGFHMVGSEITSGGLLAANSAIAHGVDLSNLNVRGTIDLSDSQIGRHLIAGDVEVDGGEAAIDIGGARVGRSVELGRLRAVGRVRMQGLSAGGGLNLSEARIFGSEYALAASGLSLGGACVLHEATIVGPCELSEARIAGALDLGGSTIKVESGPALALAHADVSTDVRLGPAFETIGAVAATGIRVGGSFSLSESKLKSAAIARGISDRSSARTGAGLRDVVQTAALIGEHDELALDLSGSTIAVLKMPTRADQRPSGIVDLTGATVDRFDDGAGAWPQPRTRSFRTDGTDIDHLRLDGFTYRTLGNPSGGAVFPKAARGGDVAAARIAWLDGQTREEARTHVRAAPWRQLARCLHAQGYRSDAAAVMSTYRRRAIRAKGTPLSARILGRLADITCHFGTQPLRALGLFAGLVIAAAVVWSSAAAYCTEDGCRDETILVKTAGSAYTETGFGRGYPDFHPIAYALDTATPVVDFGYADHWRVNLAYGALGTIEIPNPVAILDLMTAGEPPTLMMPITVTVGSLLYAFQAFTMLVGALLIVAFLISLPAIREGL
ncbi:MAG: hypothetical protein AAFQ45_10835 [Pseudomonadota bacterium]